MKKQSKRVSAPVKKRPARESARPAPPVAPATTRKRDPRELVIVGVGASAGGLDAFTQMLQGLAPSPGVAIVFVQHLSPQHDSALVPLLSGKSPLPVIQATEGMRVEVDHVYVIPPNVQMVIDGGDDLHLRPRPGDRSQYTPVDSFLSSLAAAAGARAIGVVLSGTASDGAHGIREIKAAGGITVAQSPSSAKYDGMPRATIATGMVDLILSPDLIGAKLSQLAAHRYIRVPQQANELQVSDEDMKEIFDLLRPASGVDFKHYKMPTIKRRLFRRMALLRINEPADYVRVLRGDPAEVRNLYQDLLIHVTRFFREPDSFEALARDVFPSLVEGRKAEQPIRVWVSGCATGEEAYSVGIALTEFLQRDHADKRVQIFATDVSEAAVEQARLGVYPSTIEADVSSDRLRRYFSKGEGGYRVTKMIRDLCVFARQDLTKDPPFSRLDLVLCRNVLIYMDASLQKKLLSIFHYALNPDGFLVLGQAETAGANGTLFSLVDKKFRIHRKKATRWIPAMNFPADYSGSVGLSKRTPPDSTALGEKLLLGEVSRVLMDRFAPPGVVVDSDLEIVQFRGQTGAYLEPAPGEASLNVLKMAREGLLYGLRTALHTARKSRGSVVKHGLRVHAGRSWKPVSVEVIPLTVAGRAHYLVLFHERPGKGVGSAPKPAPPAPPRAKGSPRGAQFEFLERELAASREYLQSIIQELEAANEELQSANEEILSSNEELQSTNEELDTAKEELQSTNEELNTVNEEMNGRNEELSRINSDLLNLIGSIQVAIVIVSADLRIRRFTPMAEKVLNLIPSDLDRSIAHINPNLDAVDLAQLIAECIDAIQPFEREVRDRDGRWYSLRIRPYRSVHNKIDGAVLSLFDIDASKRFEEGARTANEFAEAVLMGSATPMAVLDDQLRVRIANEPFTVLMTSGRNGPIDGKHWTDVVAADGSVEQLQALVTADSGGSPTVAELQVAYQTRKIRLSAQSFPQHDVPGRRMVLLRAASRERPKG